MPYTGPCTYHYFSRQIPVTEITVGTRTYTPVERVISSMLIADKFIVDFLEHFDLRKSAA